MKGLKKQKKIVVIGAGNVGSTIALLAALKSLGNIVLVDSAPRKAHARALDIAESAPVHGFEVSLIGTNNFKKAKNADIVCVAAGIPSKAGMKREERLAENLFIVKKVARKIAKVAPKAICIVVTNPLDIMTLITYQQTGFPKNRVIGMSGVLDTARFKRLIADALEVSPKKVFSIVIGSHNELMVPLVSQTRVNGFSLSKLLSPQTIAQIIKKTRNAGPALTALANGSAFFAPAAATVAIMEAIVKNKKTVLPCSALLEGEYGVHGIFLGVPAKIGANGIEKIIELKLDRQEQKLFQQSAVATQKIVSQLKKKTK